MASTAAPVLGFSHVNLLVDDLDAARRFYGEVLGLEELPRPTVGGEGAWFRIGNLQLHLSAVAEMAPGAATSVSHIALHLATEAFEERVEGIAARGGTLSRGAQSRVQDGVPVFTAFLRDPSGNLIELTDVGPLG